MNSLLKSPYKNIFIIGLLCYIITAFFSEGYHHSDEHFQILEFCNYKLGNTPSNDLAWEFQYSVRSALLPTIAFIIIKAFNLIGIYNPFTYTLILRLFSALLSWFIVCKICLLLIKDFSSATGKRIFLLMSLFLWFIPYISVRFSAENWSAITFLSSIYLILLSTNEKTQRNYIQLSLAGLLIGFSFFFRFQTGFAIVGLCLWISFVKKVHLKGLLMLIFSGMLSISICVILDYWFYGKFVLTPFNYFYTQVIENVNSNWGDSFPWWYYFKFFIIDAIPPLSVLLLVFFFIGIYKKPWNVFTWCMIPFLIIHFIYAHKEMRFMFPIVFGFIYLTAIGIDSFIVKEKYKQVGRVLFILIVIINLPPLIFRMFMPAQEAISYYKFLYTYSSKKEMVLLCKQRNAYELAGLNVNFYKSPSVKCFVLNDNQEISNYLNKNKLDSAYLFEKTFQSDTQLIGYKKETIYCFYPKWLLGIDLNKWQSRTWIWNIEKLRKQ